MSIHPSLAFPPTIPNGNPPEPFTGVVPLDPAEIGFTLKLGSEAPFEHFAAAGASDLVDLSRLAVA